MTRVLALTIALAAAPAAAKDYMVVVNDQERAALHELLDAAVRSQGLQGNYARNAVILADKLTAAPVVVERKDPPEENKE